MDQDWATLAGKQRPQSGAVDSWTAGWTAPTASSCRTRPGPVLDLSHEPVGDAERQGQRHEGVAEEVEAPPRIELGNGRFAVSCLTSLAMAPPKPRYS